MLTRFDLVAIKGLSASLHAKEPGGTSRLDIRVSLEFKAKGIPVVDLDEVTSDPAAINPHSQVLVYWQTQGFLSPNFAREVGIYLRFGWTVVEHNIFGLASPWRPLHQRYFVLVSSHDSAFRYAIKQKIRSGQKRTPVHVLHKTARGPILSAGGNSRGGIPRSFLRIGRPDPRKWTKFELDFVTRLARQVPEHDFRLTLVGFPGPMPRNIPANLDLVLVGYQENLQPLFDSHDIYIHDSRIGETYGNAIAEAATSGLRILATVNLLKDCGHLDYLGDLPVTIGTPRALVREAKQAWSAVKATPGPMFSQLSVEKFCTHLLDIASGRVGAIEPTVVDFFRHLRRARSRLTFGRPPLSGLVIAAESLRALRHWRSRD